MANSNSGNPYKLLDIRKPVGDKVGTVLAEVNNLSSVSLLRTRLKALSGTTYTDARLDAMTRNDMVYALRLSTGDKLGVG